MPTIAQNKRAGFDYSIQDEFEAGIVLSGAEVKSCKLGHVQLTGAYASIEDGELWLKQARISPYQTNNQRDYNPDRPRKLLMKKEELIKLHEKTKQEGLTLIVKSLYTTRGLVKVKLALGRGKKKRDKRSDIKRRELDIKIGRAMRRRG